MKSLTAILQNTVLAIFFFTFAFTCSASGQMNNQVRSPEKFFGFEPGSDRELISYEQLIDYLHRLDKSSPKIKMVEIGKSPLGKPMYVAFISSAENIVNLDKLKNINKELALNYDLSNEKREKYFSEGKVFVLGTLSMHSDEVGPSQAAPLIAYNFITSDDSDITKYLSDVVYMMVPCHNPDGMDMVVENYKKYKGTKYEGSSLPGVYHKYIGHDNNRDFVTLTQEDTKAIAGIYNKTWFPQVMVEKHQMGDRGPRYFVPPMHDPIAVNVDAGIWNWTGVFGSNLMTDMTKAGLKGVSQHYLFDDYWPGSTETAIWKNVIGFLTECASADYATPVFVEPNELRVYGKGLSEYEKSVNMPQPWPGGWWRLGDIVQYEIISTKSILKTASLHRKEILKFRNDICKSEVMRGKTEAPYYFILPQTQHDKSELVHLVNLLDEQGIDLYKLNQTITIDNKIYQKGDIVIPMAQPFRAFIKEVMEKQNYPVRHYTPDGKVMKPYDITSWSLPLHMGVASDEINEKIEIPASQLNKIIFPFNLKEKPADNFKSLVFTINNNESYKAAFLASKLGLDVQRLTGKTTIGGKPLPAGSFIVSANKSTKSKLDELLENLTVSPLFIQNENEFETEKFNIPKIAVVESYFHDMDAGWTRFLFDKYFIPYKTIKPGEFEKTDFAKNYDVVVFPSENKSVLMEGKYKSGEGYTISNYPPEFTKGIGKKGMEKLMTFLDKGGIIVSWGNSAELFMGTLTIKRTEKDKEEFQLPVRDISKNLSKDGLYVPGSLLKVQLKDAHHLTYGMNNELGIFFRGRPVFATSIPHFDMDRRVVALFPKENILISGYAEKVEKLKNRTAMVWLKKGKGQLVLFGFNPEFRGSTNSSFKLLFNSLLLRKIE